ncbi:MAG TPA: hypothetical protein VN726_21070 [Hanamia sp.]|nr:hypothetical protein [Hanamia sp.]
MHKKIIIKRLLAFALLAVFALSTTPTMFLHKIFADHKDFVEHTSPKTDAPQLNLSGIDCHCNSLVVIAPYIFNEDPVSLKFSPVFSGYTTPVISSIPFSQLFFFELRGPPRIA